MNKSHQHLLKHQQDKVNLLYSFFFLHHLMKLNLLMHSEIYTMNEDNVLDIEILKIKIFISDFFRIFYLT